MTAAEAQNLNRTVDCAVYGLYEFPNRVGKAVAEHHRDHTDNPDVVGFDHAGGDLKHDHREHTSSGRCANQPTPIRLSHCAVIGTDDISILRPYIEDESEPIEAATD